MEKKTLKEVCDDFTKFLKEHSQFPRPMCDNCDDDDDDEAPEEVAELLQRQAKLFSDIRPKAADILIEKEHEFVDAIRQLIDKHKSLETVEQIEKLTKDILKLCK